MVFEVIFKRQKLSIFVFEVSVLLCITDAQTTDVSTFAFADSRPTFADVTTKVFTTGIHLIPISMNQSAFNESAFVNASTEFYSSQFSGFTSVAVHRISVNNATDTSAESIEVVYQVAYDYAAFSDEGSNDSVVLNRIGSPAVVKSGLEASTSMQGLYSVSSNSSLFDFSGNLLCPSATCIGSFVVCTESSLGLSPVCRSICFSSFFCENDGTCVHKGASLSPRCSCVGSSSVWYLGGRCEYKVEVWMIIVFLVGFIAIILLIILIGVACCRRKTKPRDRNHTRETPIAKQRAASKENSLSPNKHERLQESRNSMIESDTLPLSPATRITSNALVTVQESFSESDDPSETQEIPANGPMENSVEPRNPPVLEGSNDRTVSSKTSSDDSDTTDREESDSISDVAITRISPRSSVTNSEEHGRRYNSLHFPDEQRRDSEAYTKLTLV